MKTKSLYFIRHCKAGGQESNAPLTKDGEQSAKDLVPLLEKLQIDYIISSPFKRAVQTIEPFAHQAGLKIHIDEALSERILSKEPMDDWLVQLKKTFEDIDLTFPGGESSREALGRILNVVNEVSGIKGVKNVGIVSHGNIMSLLINHFDSTFGFDEWSRMKNPDIFLLEGKNISRVEIEKILSN
ncbi:histidine phosphatase family protein [Psychrobacillus sp. MER TA 171]|uniref:histidine phosphatase family protein n=1 Tax=Psychrobacillus sp. MER TA 171 TaxID=2939577 RepID=UPI00203B59E9|nr:histidine phosphatase family protein [Psychrobacillus sp. MER TA 171]MCM3357428.1 histidine phosphatase family protein [Psychrobacillus sp. MER TA 171]